MEGEHQVAVPALAVNRPEDDENVADDGNVDVATAQYLALSAVSRRCPALSALGALTSPRD